GYYVVYDSDGEVISHISTEAYEAIQNWEETETESYSESVSGGSDFGITTEKYRLVDRGIYIMSSDETEFDNDFHEKYSHPFLDSTATYTFK
ncbi:hypothetical protein, partial [Roseibium sp. RKSG952]|uniref:hypothetical protein n=1 Tax=Roseibium sp. RKSG952 TaxID=2529384 RepID=UPI001AD8CDB5